MTPDAHIQIETDRTEQRKKNKLEVPNTSSLVINFIFKGMSTVSVWKM